VGGSTTYFLFFSTSARWYAHPCFAANRVASHAFACSCASLDGRAMDLLRLGRGSCGGAQAGSLQCGEIARGREEPRVDSLDWDGVHLLPLGTDRRGRGDRGGRRRGLVSGFVPVQCSCAVLGGGFRRQV
jgi:hypothetical protein